MDHIVYFLGAGFSAPLGLPVMADFIIKAKDMYFGSQQKYADFAKVFATLHELHKAKSYYKTDLFNIEEVLSILETSNSISAPEQELGFKEFIRDVIRYYTPDQKNATPGDAHDYRKVLFGGDPWAPYGFFVASLCGLRAYRHETPRTGYSLHPPTESQVEYSVVTLNYDEVIEGAIRRLRPYFHGDHGRPSFCTELDAQGALPQNRDLCLAKLHGTLDPLTIVPPTWNKRWEGSVLSAWQLALKLLENANYIRILGYSLPTADSYVPYLFKAAVLRSEHLKGIDVICLDPDGSVRDRYDRFIDFNFYRFVNGDVRDYLDTVQKEASSYSAGQTGEIGFDRLEGAHDLFMRGG